MTAREGRWDEGGATHHYDPDELTRAKLRMKAEKDVLDKEEDLFQGDTKPMEHQYGGEDNYHLDLDDTTAYIDDDDEWETVDGKKRKKKKTNEYDPIGEPDIFDTDGQKFIDMFGKAEEPEEAEEDVSVGGPPAGDTIPANGLYIDDEEEIPAEEAFTNPEESWNLLSDYEKEAQFGDWMSAYSDNEANFAQYDYGKVMFYQLPQGFKTYLGEAKATEEQISSDTYYYDYSDYWNKGNSYVRSGLALQAGISTDLANTEWDNLPSDAQAKIRDAGYVTSYEVTAKEQAPEIFSHMVVTDPSSPEPFKAVCDHCGYSADSVYPEMQNHLKQAHDIAVESSIASESEWRVHTITHGEVPVTLGVQADEIDAVNAVKRMYFDDGFINEGEILGVTKIGESLHGYPLYGTEAWTVEGDEQEISLLSQLLDNELEEEAKGDDETEDIALIAQLLGEEDNPEHAPAGSSKGGQFVSKGGGGDSGGKHSDKSEKDLVKSIKGGSKDWHDWGRNEKTEDAYAEIERRNREVPTPTSKLGGKVFRDDPDAVSKMEQKVKYWEDQKEYWNKIIKFPHRDYQTHNQLGDARWFMGTNISTNLRDAKKKLEGIKEQQGRGTDLVRKPTYKDGKKRFYYSEEPKGEPPEEQWQKGGESYAKEQDFRTNCIDGGEHIPESGSSIDKCTKCGKDIFLTGEGSGYWFTNEDAINWDSIYNESLKKNEAFPDSTRPVSPNTLKRYEEPIDLPTGKNAMDQTYGVSEPETPDGQDLTGITVGEAESEYERIRGLIEMSEMPETVEDIERWASSWGADKDLVKKVFDQEFGTYEGDEETTEPYLEDNWGYKEGYPKKSLADKIKGILEGHEEIIEQKPYKPVYHYYKQHPFGRRAGKQNPFGEAKANEKTCPVCNGKGKYFHTKEEDWYPCPTCGGDGEVDDVATEQVSQDTLEQAHIWWDNKYPERQWSDMRIGQRQDAILAFLRDPTTTLNEGGVGSGRKKLWKSQDPKTKEKHHVGWKNYGIDDYLDKAEKDYKEKSKEQFEDPTPWVSIGKMALDTAKDVIFPDKDESEEQSYADMTDKEMEDLGDYEGHPHQAEEDTPMNAGKVNIKKIAKNKTLITPAEEARLVCNDCDLTFDNVSAWEEHGEYHDIKVNKDEPAVEGGKGSGKKDHKGWMRAIEEEHTYDFCENCDMITEQVNHNCEMCGKKVIV